MLDFVNDYSEGAHEKILQRLLETNMEKLSGYGTDQYCESAKQKIREVCECPEADIYFLVGGTQTNATVIDAILSQYEGVVAANTGHISTHEAGAIEASAHKVLAIPHKNGKITAKAVKQYFTDFYADGNHEHMVFPGMVYISFKKKVSITKTDFKKRIKDIFMTFTLWNSDQKLRESYREVLFWGIMECLT